MQVSLHIIQPERSYSRETTFEEIYVMQRDNSTVIASLLGMKGDLDVSGAEELLSD